MKKKNLIEAFEMILDICDKAQELDNAAAKSLVCMLIDTISAVHGEKAADIAEEVRDLVTRVNNEMGAYEIGVRGA